MNWNDAIATRFWAKVDKSNPSGCWNWTACVGRDGYPRFKFPEGQLATRFSALMAGMDIDGCIVHTCGNVICVNPDHLLAGTQADKRGRSKLTEGDVREIRERLESGQRPKDIANDFDVKPNAISQIKCGLTWRHVR